MIQVSYVSRTSEPFSAEQVLELLVQCRDNNRERGVTGMLLYANGTFLQAIEGEDEVIDKLVEEIWKDPRHADIELLSRKAIQSREYSDWSMGFDQVTDDLLGEIEGLASFRVDNFSFDYLIGHQPVVESLMEHFRHRHWDPLIGELDAKDKAIRQLTSALAQERDRARVTRLALQSVTEAARKGSPSASLLKLCDSALESFKTR